MRGDGRMKQRSQRKMKTEDATLLTLEMREECQVQRAAGCL